MLVISKSMFSIHPSQRQDFSKIVDSKGYITIDSSEHDLHISHSGRVTPECEPMRLQVELPEVGTVHQLKIIDSQVMSCAIVKEKK